MPYPTASTDDFAPAVLPRPAPRPLHRGIGLWLLLGVLSQAGCRTVQPAVSLPTRHSLSGEQLLVHSDIQLPKNHPLIADLGKLRRQIADTLELPIQDQPV